MKKYISIFSLISIFLLHSCERSTGGIISENQDFTHTNKSSLKDQQLNTTAKNEEPSASDIPSANNFNVNDEDEPRRDKQHWRTVQDSIR
ncbi:hypothetical protein [Chryseobacterium turcicum]|uniref:Uncharacterized protein n=1 Tax=Chryseobacterium turcicum TaxID=2898076 RepID=A0A9Q3YXT5_9FLAO|nr:hypothetical protein [Chryseobacterium turcicum]MCD1117537.1 hypothetical protein [Chryseobacterium turcicum]